MNTDQKEQSTSPFNLNHGSGQRWPFNFAPRPPYPRWNNQSETVHFGEEKKSLATIRNWITDRPAYMWSRYISLLYAVYVRI